MIYVHCYLGKDCSPSTFKATGNSKVHSRARHNYTSFLYFCDISLSIAIFLKYFSLDKIILSLTMVYEGLIERLTQARDQSVISRFSLDRASQHGNIESMLKFITHFTAYLLLVVQECFGFLKYAQSLPFST